MSEIELSGTRGYRLVVIHDHLSAPPYKVTVGIPRQLLVHTQVDSWLDHFDQEQMIELARFIEANRLQPGGMRAPEDAEVAMLRDRIEELEREPPRHVALRTELASRNVVLGDRVEELERELRGVEGVVRELLDNLADAWWLRAADAYKSLSSWLVRR